MRIERDHDGFGVQLMRALNHVVDHALMRSMNSVEIPDTDYTSLEVRRNIFKFAEDLHR